MSAKYIVCIVLVVMHTAYAQLTDQDMHVLFQQHCTQLKNTAISQEPLLIVFSGTPGMGKSFVAKQLEDIYQAVRVSTDDVRHLFSTIPSLSAKDYTEALQHYAHYFLNHFDMPNKRLIVDASIDRTYPAIFSFCEKKNIKVIVVRLEASRDTVIKRLREREGDKAAWYFKELDSWFSDYDAFAHTYTNYIPYVNLEGSDIGQLKRAIDARLEK